MPRLRRFNARPAFALTATPAPFSTPLLALFAPFALPFHLSLLRSRQSTCGTPLGPRPGKISLPRFLPEGNLPLPLEPVTHCLSRR